MYRRPTIRALFGAALLVAFLAALWRVLLSPDGQALAQGNKPPNPLVISKDVTTGLFDVVGLKKTPGGTEIEYRRGKSQLLQFMPGNKYKLEIAATGFQPQIIIGTEQGFREVARSAAGVNGSATLEFTGPQLVNISDSSIYQVAAVTTTVFPKDVGRPAPVKIGSYTLKVTDLQAPLTADLVTYDPWVDPNDPKNTMAGTFRIECVATGRMWHEAGLRDYKVSTRYFSNDGYTTFILERDGAYYRIRCVASGRYLHVGGYPQDTGDAEIVCTLPEKYSVPVNGNFQQLVDDTYLFSLEKQPNSSYRFKCKANNKYLHVDGNGDNLLSTRYQANDDYTRFYFRSWSLIPSSPKATTTTDIPDFHDLNFGLGAQASQNYPSFTDAVGNQGNQGACVAFSVCSTLGTLVIRDWTTFNVAKPAAIGDFRNKYNVSLFDAKWFYAQRDNKDQGDNGWWIPNALDKATNVTIPFKFGQPANPGDGKPYYGVRISKGGWARLTNKTEMRRELSMDNPLNTSFEVFDDFQKNVSLLKLYRGPGPNAQSKGWHAVMVLGYRTPSAPDKTDGVWVVQNSWGADWGTNGYFSFGEGVCSIDPSMYVIRNVYLCDHTGRKLELEERNQVVQNVLNAAGK